MPPAPLLLAQSCHGDNEWGVAAKRMQGSSLHPAWNQTHGKQEGEAEGPHQEGTHGLEPSSSHVCDIQVSSGHSRPPIQPAQLPVGPKEQGLQKQRDLAPSGP